MLSYPIKSRNFFIEKIKNLLVIDYIPFLSSFLSIFIGVWVSLPDHVDKAAIVSALNSSAMFSIFLYIITDRVVSLFARTRDLAEIYNRFSALEQMIASGDRVVCLGQYNNAISRISFSISQATTIWNTYFFYEVIPLFNYSKQNKNSVIAAMREFLKRDGAKWIDIISDVDDHFLERKNEILSSGLEQNCYQCFKLINNSPYINFIVLEFDGLKKSEVFFGFGKHPNDEIGNVFYSTDEKIVTLFSRLHRTLRSSSVSVPVFFGNDYDKHNLKVTGIWKSISHNNGDFKDFAFVSINQVGRNTYFNGFIFNKNGVMEGWFEAEDVLMSRKKMIFLYYKVSSKEVTSDIKALGIYDFGDKNSFIGKLIDVDKVESTLIRGKRVTKEEEEMFIKENWQSQDIERIIQEFMNELKLQSPQT